MQQAATLQRDHLQAELAVWHDVLAREHAPAAPVIDLDAHRDARQHATRGVHVRRRLGLIVAVLGLAMALVLLIGAGGATAELQRPDIAGQTVLAPGQTLWDVAVAHAPPGTDARTYLEAITSVNGFDDAQVAAWTVVLLPATGR